MKTKERNQQAISFTEKQIILLQEEHDIDDEMNEEETKELNDDPYFLLAQRLANAPQVKVRDFFKIFVDQWFYVLMYIRAVVRFSNLGVLMVIDCLFLFLSSFLKPQIHSVLTHPWHPLITNSFN